MIEQNFRPSAFEPWVSMSALADPDSIPFFFAIVVGALVVYFFLGLMLGGTTFFRPLRLLIEVLLTRDPPPPAHRFERASNRRSRFKRAVTTPFFARNFMESYEDGSKFEPWKSDFRMAVLLWVIGFVWMGLSLWLFRETQQLLFSGIALVSVGPYFLGFSWLESGISRRRGKTIEVEFRELLPTFLPEDWALIDTSLQRHIGDIDVALRLPNNEIYVVEIKSWNYWSGYVRQQRALRQVRRQARSLNASHRAIWLPKALEKIERFQGDVFIVSGHSKRLPARLVNSLGHNVTVSFPRVPSRPTRDALKALGLKWSPVKKHWRGRLNPADLQDLQPFIAQDDGQITTGVSLGDAWPNSE